jgi:predicted GNAT superfamily acetyltransferase
MGSGDERRAGLESGLELGPLREVESLGLNNAHAKETSLLDEGGLAALLGMAFYARGIDGGATALLIALDQDAGYVNPNFGWFTARFGARFDSFIYIDRVIVAEAARGRGIARLLYEDLFAAARQAGHMRVVCEVNLEPPNAASDAFHAAMGFEEIGRAAIYGGAKVVRYFERRVG